MTNEEYRYHMGAIFRSMTDPQRQRAVINTDSESPGLTIPHPSALPLSSFFFLGHCCLSSSCLVHLCLASLPPFPPPLSLPSCSPVRGKGREGKGKERGGGGGVGCVGREGKGKERGEGGGGGGGGCRGRHAGCNCLQVHTCMALPSDLVARCCSKRTPSAPDRRTAFET